MFGMGFTEILIIAVIAILFLGPDKLPSTMVEIAKFFRNMKNTIGSVKDSLEEEMNVSEIKQEALAYKKELDKVTNVQHTIKSNINSYADSILDDDEDLAKKAPSEPQEVTFKKKKNKEKKEEVDNV
jgi:sec-independent protein translocase protein TatB